ncbi:transposable element Tc1 transposase [Trichonephila clavipes]|nr:transposable element Tc1 transposase [Trichonephila clavipes]
MVPNQWHACHWFTIPAVGGGVGTSSIRKQRRPLHYNGVSVKTWGYIDDAAKLATKDGYQEIIWILLELTGKINNVTISDVSSFSGNHLEGSFHNPIERLVYRKWGEAPLAEKRRRNPHVPKIAALAAIVAYSNTLHRGSRARPPFKALDFFSIDYNPTYIDRLLDLPFDLYQRISATNRVPTFTVPLTNHNSAIQTIQDFSAEIVFKKNSDSVATPSCHVRPTNQDTLSQAGPPTSGHIHYLDMGWRNASRSVSQNCWEQWTREGTHARKTGSGATRKTTRREDRRIVRQALVDPTVTRSMLRADVGVAIVPQTISRHLAEANLKSKRPFRALPLTPKHRQLRLQWCQARSLWNVTDWQKVVFSDESRFVFETDDNRVRV